MKNSNKMEKKPKEYLPEESILALGMLAAKSPSSPRYWPGTMVARERSGLAARLAANEPCL